MVQYVLITKGLNVNRGEGREHYRPTRPYTDNKNGTTTFHDDPATAPTLVEFDEFCEGPDVEFLLRTGGLREYAGESTHFIAADPTDTLRHAAKPSIPAPAEGGDDGESSSG